MYISGFHAVEEYLKRRTPRGELLVSGGGKRVRALRRMAEEKGVPVREMPAEDIARITGLEDHRGMVLSTPDSVNQPADDLKAVVSSLSPDTGIILLLDGITDPHNLGAILRSAEQFGVDCVVLPKRNNAQLNDTVARVSAGAVEYVRTVTVPNVSRAVEYLKQEGFWVYGADAGGDPVYRADLQGRVALVLGSEGSGISRLVADHCDTLLAIPSLGRIDSLNVSVAAGIFLYEIRRQQGFG